MVNYNDKLPVIIQTELSSVSFDSIADLAIKLGRLKKKKQNQLFEQSQTSIAWRVRIFKNPAEKHLLQPAKLELGDEIFHGTNLENIRISSRKRDHMMKPRIGAGPGSGLRF